MGFQLLRLNSMNKSYSFLFSNSIFILQNPSKIHPLTTLLHFQQVNHLNFGHDHSPNPTFSSEPSKDPIFTIHNPDNVIINPPNSHSFNHGTFDYHPISSISSNTHKNPIFTLFQFKGVNNSYKVITNPPNSQTFKRWHFGHSHSHSHSNNSNNNKESENIFKLGLAADIGLTIGKAVTGYFSGSTAIIADAAHSLSDVVLSAVALVSYEVARAPRDKEHPYGHGKFETLGALGISGMLLVTAGGIAWHAADILLALLATAPDAMQSFGTEHEHHQSGHNHHIDMTHPFLALNMAIVSIGVKECSATTLMLISYTVLFAGSVHVPWWLLLL